MAAEGILSVSVESVVEDVLKQHGTIASDNDMAARLASRREEEAASRRYEAASWLRRTVGAVGSRELAEEPSEEEFRLGLRNGIILCNALNKLHPGTIPKVVEAPSDFVPPPDGAALCAYQYFENVRNFLVALEDLHLPTFETSDLEKGGKGSRVVNCVLALKSYNESKQIGKQGSYKHGSIFRSTSSSTSNNGNGKYFVRKNSEPFMNSLLRTPSSERIQEGLSVEQNLSLDVSIESSEMTSHSLHMLVHTMLSDKKPEEVPVLVESILGKVMHEFESRISTQNELVKNTLKDLNEVKSFIRPTNFSEPTPNEAKMEKEEKHVIPKLNEEEKPLKEEPRAPILNFDQQEREIQELRHMLSNIKSGVMNMKIQYHEEFSKIGKHLYVVSTAASGYHKVLEENRKLYNQVQDLKGNIRVYCRVRPFMTRQGCISSVANYDDGQITITTPANYGKVGRKSFNFNKVFGPSATQEEVFSDMRPLIRSVLDGYNVCIFAYGQTGSGKTHTMSGPKVLTEETLGVNCRALNDLFHMSAERRSTFSYEIYVQMIEIYNEQVRDLLASGGVTKKLEIRNNSQKGGPAVPEANMVPVSSTSHVIELMNLGQKNRAVGCTAMNDRSSRSHSCLTVHVQGRDLTSGATLRGCMHLVDLAGSERVDKSEAKGDRLKEAQHINKSLSALGDVISSLAQKNSHVPYRNSKLTQLLQDSLGGQAKTLMFVHISPESDAVGETLSTLKFAERVATVELGAARLNKDSTEVKDLKEQIASLKAQLARKENGGDFEQVGSIISTPDISRIRSAVGTQSLRQPMEEVGNIEVRSNLPSFQKKPSVEAQEISAETDSSPWIDKTNIDNTNNNENLSFLSSPRGDYTPLPTSFYQRYSSNISVTYQDSEVTRGTGSEIGGSDDSDELDFGTSYTSSEQDMLMWRSDIPKLGTSVSSNNSSGSMSRLKKPQAKLGVSHDMRSGNLAYKPSPSRKMQTPGKSLRQPTDGKRTITSKIGNGK